MTVQPESHDNWETVTVGELIEVFEGCGPDTRVWVTWKGAHTGVRKENVFLGTFDGVRPELIIDVEDYG